MIRQDFCVQLGRAWRAAIFLSFSARVHVSFVSAAMRNCLDRFHAASLQEQVHMPIPSHPPGAVKSKAARLRNSLPSFPPSRISPSCSTSTNAPPSLTSFGFRGTWSPPVMISDIQSRRLSFPRTCTCCCRGSTLLLLPTPLLLLNGCPVGAASCS